MKRKTRVMQSLAVVAFLLLCFNNSFGQNINQNFFGINSWMYWNGSTNHMAEHLSDLQDAEMKIMRIGGNYANTTANTTSYWNWYVEQIEDIQSIGAEPLVQLPIDLSETEIVEWYNYFNNTKNLGIKYWGIGNEPDPSSNWEEWYNGTYYQDGRNYTGFRGQFRKLAKKLKSTDPNSIIVGPDFRHFWGFSGMSDPIDTYYKNFIEDIGLQKTDDGQYYVLDIFATHFYGYKTESQIGDFFDQLNTHIDAVNTQRSGKDLKIAFGEVNTVTGEYPKPWNFKAGQFLVLMAKEILSVGGEYMTPWSVYENDASQGITDFSLYNSTTNNDRRSTMHHMALMANNIRDNYMSSFQNTEADDIVTMGMKGADGYTIFIMNTTESDSHTFHTKLNNSYPSGSEDVLIAFDGSVDTELSGTIAAKTTKVYTFSTQGTLLKEISYAVGDTNPTVIIHNEDDSDGGGTDPGNDLTTGYYQIQNVYTNGYLRPPGGSATENIVQDLDPDLSWSSTMWSFETANISGYFYIRNKYTNKILRAASGNESAEITQVDLEGNENFGSSMWAVQDAGDGNYWIYNQWPGKYIRPEGASMNDEHPIVQQDVNTTYTSFRWKLITTGLKSAASSFEAEETAMPTSINIFPNPAEDKLFVNGMSSLKGNIVSLSGQVIKQINQSNSTIDISNLSQGTYILFLHDDEKIIKHKFIKL